jgi:hypothetical protein
MVLGTVFVVVQVRNGLRELDRDDLPGPSALAAAAGLALTGHISLGAGWSRLLPDVEPRSSVALSFYASQLGKYVPLGIAQPLGQVAMLKGLDVSAGRAFISWSSHIAVTVAAGLSVGAGLMATPGLSPAGRVAAAACLGSLVLVWRPTLATILELVCRAIGRVPSAMPLPSQRALLESFLGAVV